MTDRTMTLVNAEEFGALIVQWAKAPETRPKTVADFIKQVPKTAVVLGPGYAPEEAITYVDLRPNAECLTIVLSDKGDLDAPLPKAAYPLPAFYQDLAFHVDPDVSEPERLKLARIADYSTGKCQ